jgi:hypothetical protein
MWPLPCAWENFDAAMTLTHEMKLMLNISPLKQNTQLGSVYCEPSHNRQRVEQTGKNEKRKIKDMCK